MADGAHGVGCLWPQSFAAHAASLLRHTHGRKRCRPAHRANDFGPRRHFDYTGLYPSGAGPFADGLSKTSSESQGTIVTTLKTTVSRAVADFLRHLRERNASPHTVKAYTQDLANFAAYAGS